jgi:hypothetical protein
MTPTSSPSLAETVQQDIVIPVRASVARNPLPHALGLAGGVLFVVLLTVAFAVLMGSAGVVIGLFLGLTCVGSLGVVSYALGTTGLVDLLRRTKDAV